MFKVKITAKFPGEKEFNNFKQEFEDKFLKMALDEGIMATIPALQADLKKIINQDIRNTEETPLQSAANDNINLAKVDADLVEYLTGVSIDEINKTKKQQTSVHAKTMVVRRDKWGGPIARINLDVGPGETMQSQYSRAKDFFNKALFVIPQQDGTTSYKLNTGVDLSRYVKIVCSTDTGITNNSEARLERFKEIGGKAEWTLKQEAFDKVIEHDNSGFLDLTSVISSVKEGNYKRAITALERFSFKNAASREQLDQVIEKVTKLDGNEDPKSNIVLHQSIIKLIDNIRIAKQFTKTKTLYRLETNTDMDAAYQPKFFDSLNTKLNQWVINYEVKWFESVLKKVKQLIKNYTGQ